MKRAIAIGLLWLLTSATAWAGVWAQSNADLLHYSPSDADTIIKTQLLTAFILNSQLQHYPLGVSVKNGSVYLFGTVENNIQRALAEGIAYAAPGIKQVVDNITVDPTAPKIFSQDNNFAQKVQDLHITAFVTHQLQNTLELKPYSITVSVLNNAVTLTGEVYSFEHKDLAGRVAAKTPGTVMVINNLKVIANA